MTGSLIAKIVRKLHCPRGDYPCKECEKKAAELIDIIRQHTIAEAACKAGTDVLEAMPMVMRGTCSLPGEFTCNKEAHDAAQQAIIKFLSIYPGWLVARNDEERITAYYRADEACHMAWEVFYAVYQFLRKPEPVRILLDAKEARVMIAKMEAILAAGA